MYKTVFIGAGPSNLSSILHLDDVSNILLIEKGKNILDRPKKEVISGFGGAGCFSDFKLSYGYEVGGSLLDYVTEDAFDNYVEKALQQYQNFTTKPLIWSEPTIHDIPDLTMITQKVIHVGTAEGFNILSNIYKHLAQSGVQMIYDTDVIDIQKCEGGYKLITSQGEEIYTEQVVVGTGQKDTLLNNASVTKDYMDKEHKKFQLGVRVEVPNEDNRFADILAANYDFKYYKRYETEHFNLRIRTFCCNSGNAHVAVENANGITSYNGHAIGDGVNNGLVNFGVIAEIMPKDNSFNQEEFMKLVRFINNAMQDNPYDFKENFEQKFVLLYEIDQCMSDFLRCFNADCKISDGHFYTPEYKNTSPSFNYGESLNELLSGLFLNGDIMCTRGIITSSACGIMTAEVLNAKRKKDLEEENKKLTYILRRK